MQPPFLRAYEHSHSSAAMLVTVLRFIEYRLPHFVVLDDNLYQSNNTISGYYSKRERIEKDTVAENTMPPQNQQNDNMPAASHPETAPELKSSQGNKYDIIPNVSEARWKEIAEKYPHFPRNLDIVAKRKEAFLRLPSFVEDWVVENMLQDSRDAIMVSLIANILCTTVPLVVMLYKRPSHMLGAFTIAFTLFMYLQRFILMMHYAEHRKLFKRPYHNVFQYLLSYGLCVLFGIPPGMYRLHHVVMHHIENNVFNEDLSSTEPYQRDNFFHFLVYYYRYYTHMFMLPFYAIKKARYGMALTAFVGACLWIGLIVFGLSRHPVFTIWMGVVPGFVTGLALMFGNFSQHIFVHPSIATMPQKLKSYQFNCALSLQSMNHFDNQYAFNDGYHVTHHINSQVHWTDMPSQFLKNLEKYAENDAVVFDGLGFFDIGLHVFMGWWDSLAEHYVHFTKEKKSKEEVIAMLKVRLQPIERSNRAIQASDLKED